MHRHVPKVLIVVGIVLALYDLGARPIEPAGYFWTGIDCTTSTCIVGYNVFLMAWIGITVAGIVLHIRTRNRPHWREERKNA